MSAKHRQLFLASSLGLALLLASCQPAAAPAPAATTVPAPVATAAPAPAATRAPSATAPAAPAATPRPTVAAPAPAPAAAQPKTGGILRIGAVANPASFDMQQESSINVTMLIAPIYNNIVQYDDATGSKVVPALAESWTASADGTVFTFKIRKGVKYHDGTEVTPQDIVYNTVRIQTPPRGIRSNLAQFVMPVKSVEVVNGDSVKFTLEFPYAAFLPILAHDYYPIHPPKVVEAKGQMTTTAIGSGPFMYKNYTPGVSFELVKNPNYWEKGKPYLDGVTFPIVTDRATYIAAHRTGQIDRSAKVFGALTPSEEAALKGSNPGWQFFQSASSLSPWIQLNLKEGSKFNDVRVRKAVSLGIDRYAAFKVLAEGQGKLGGLFSSLGDYGLSQDELKKLPGFAQDKTAEIAQGKKLLADAGYPSGFDLKILSRTNQITRDTATFMAGQMQNIGIRATVDLQQDAEFFARQGKTTFEMLAYTPIDTIPDPHWMMRYVTEGTALVQTGLKDPRVTKLVEDQVREPDVKKRQALTKQLETYVLTEALHTIPVVWPITYVAVGPKVKGYAGGISDFVVNRLTDVWLAP